MGLTKDKKRKGDEMIRALLIKKSENEKKYKTVKENLYRDIRIKKNDIEDCDARIRDLKNSLKKKTITEASFNKKEEAMKMKKSKHTATLYRLQNKDQEANVKLNNVQRNIDNRIKEIKQKMNVN